MNLKATQQIRADLGISRGDNALWSDAHSPTLQLALWPEFFAPIAPKSTRKAVGFCFLDARENVAPELEEFLSDGEAPLMFVAASFAATEKWERESISAAKNLGKRAILLGARESSVSDHIFCCRFAPLEAILPRVAALIQAGGVGTLALGLRAGVPMLLAPHAHDQFDNARRAAKLGLARVRRNGDLAPQISAVLEDEELKRRLEKKKNELQNGAAGAAELLEAIL
jgi:UDP:flavonoid glycosyltransferase YjiC (YdhE family)